MKYTVPVISRRDREIQRNRIKDEQAPTNEYYGILYSAGLMYATKRIILATVTE